MTGERQADSHLSSWGFWVRKTSWTTMEAAALFAGVSPQILRASGSPLMTEDEAIEHGDAILTVTTLLYGAAIDGVLGPRSPSASEETLRYPPAAYIAWAQKYDIPVPAGLAAAVSQFAERPAYSELAAENAALREKLAEYEAAPIDPRERRSLLLMMGSLGRVLAAQHRDCRKADGTPNVSGLLRQAQLFGCASEPGKTQFNELMQEALLLTAPKE